MNAYEEHQEARKQRYQELANKNQGIGSAKLEQAHKMAEVIPFGQPILVGHHSEQRDRNYRGRINATYGKGFEAIEKAKYYEDKAASVGKASISSDDPEAIDKLQEKLAKLQTWQETMKAANKIIKSKKLTDEQKVEQLAPLGISSTAAYKLFQPDFCGRVGFPDYETTNNNANMRRIKERIEHLETETKRQDALGEVKEQHGDITYQESDRVELIFPGKPSDAIRSLLKTYGFKWSPTRTAWVRSLNATSRSYAKHIIEKIEKGEV